MSAVTELIQRGPAEALAGLLGVPLPDLTGGLPLTWHWVYLLEHPRQDELGHDGHPATTGIPSPPGPGRRRMWAGGRVTSRVPLRCGRPATRRTFVRESVDKAGRTGKLTFVTVAHEITQDGVLAVSEETGHPLPGRGHRARLAGAPVTPSRSNRRRTPARDRPGAPVPVLRPDLQRAPHPLRPRLRP